MEGHDDMTRLGISTMKGGKASMLLIDSVGAQHRGNYTCTAKNPAGVISYTSSLDIHGNDIRLLLA